MTDSDVASIQKLFSGLDRAYGTFTIDGKANERDKVSGRAQTIAKPVTPAHYKDHLDGTQSLGVIPIRGDGTVLFAALDIDDYSLNVPYLAEYLAGKRYPAVVCRSKSGGAHVYLFFTEPQRMASLRPWLVQLATHLGFPGCEIFPKQDKLAPTDTGNWINLPYYDCGRTTRYALGADGTALTFAQFIAAAETRQTSVEALSDFELEDSRFKDAPPCLRALTAKGKFPEGSRNNGLFNLAIFAQKRWPNEWQDRVEEFNQEFMTPGTPVEVKSIIRSLSKKEYAYKCNEQPIQEHCNRQLCVKCRFGVNAQRDSIDEASIPAWPEYPENAFYGIAGKVVELCCADSEADPVGVLATLLTWVGATIGNGTDIGKRGPYYHIGEDRHHTVLFTAIVGQSAKSRKGTGLSLVERIMTAVEAVLEQAGDDERNSEGYARCTVTPGPLSSGEGLIYAIRDPGDEMKKDKEGNDTGEPVDEGITDKRLLVTDGELGSAFKVMQRDGNTLSVIVRSTWDGRAVAPLTKTSRIRASTPHLCIVGHITRDELIDLISNTEVRNGFANRFLWVCVRRAKLVPFPQPLDGEEVSKLARIIARAISHARTLEHVNLATDARDLWLSEYENLTREHTGNHDAVTSRAASQAMRLALIFALLEADDMIHAVHLQAALALWRYCDDSARYLFGGGEADPIEERVLQALMDGPKTQTDLKEICADNWKAPRFNQLLQTLQGSGRIAQKKIQTKGRPRTNWSLTQPADSSQVS